MCSEEEKVAQLASTPRRAGAACRAEHKVVLHSVLPKSAIDRMRKEMDWLSINNNEAALQLVEIGARAVGLATAC